MKHKSKETTKIVVVTMTIILTILTITSTIVSILLTIKYQDSSLLQILIPCLFAELASYTGWYCWKSKSENKLKIILGFIKELKAEEISGKEDIINNLISNL